MIRKSQHARELHDELVGFLDDHERRLQQFLDDHGERVAGRREHVESRLASLEEELHHLERAENRIARHRQ